MIKEMCEQHGVLCMFTSKLFFKRFASSITINFPDHLRSEYENITRDIRVRYDYPSGGPSWEAMLTELRRANAVYNTARSQFITDLFSRFGSAFPDGTEFRMNKVSVTFYHDDPSNLATLIEAMKGSIVKVTVPRNEAEIAFLRANTNKIIQDKYFLDSYPYKITFKPSFDHSVLNQYIDNQFCELIDDRRHIDQTRAYYYSGGMQPTLFLADFNDVFLTKIGVQELIEKLEEVILRAA